MGIDWVTVQSDCPSWYAIWMLQPNREVLVETFYCGIILLIP